LAIQLRESVTVTAELEVRTDHSQRLLAQEQDRLEYEQRTKKLDAAIADILTSLARSSPDPAPPSH
jgi:hypothetical protein